jgi:tetratricopeptide (TPR) repeat protein
MKALEKDRTRRYASASELASDLRRHLANEPVLAGPPSASYRVRKFVKRHRAGVAFAATASVLVLVGLAGTTYGMVRAVRAERRATLEAETANRITDFMLNMFAINDPGEARGKTVTAKEILDRAAEGIRSGLTDQPALKARLMEAMGKVYRSLGLYGEALPLLESAVATQTAAFGRASPVVAATTTTLAGALIARGRAAEAIPILDRAIAVERATLPPGDPELARALNNMGNAHRALGHNDRALPFLQEALAVREKAFGPDDVEVAKQLVNLGGTRLNTGDSQGARRDLERALSIYERKLGPDHLDVAGPLDALATQARKSGDLVRASSLLSRALAIKEKNLGPDHPALVVSLVNLGTVQELRGDFTQAEGTFERADAIARAKLEPNHRDAVNARLALDDLRKEKAGH